MNMVNGVPLEGGGRLSLSQIGITTTNVTSDGGILVIDMQKLDKALEERPDDIATLFTKPADDGLTGTAKMNNQGVAERLNDIVTAVIGTHGSLTSKAGSEEHSLSLTKNDLHKEIMAQNDRITKMLDNLRRKEEQFYMMFSKLETAMMRADQQMASLQGLIGGGMMM